MSVEVDRLFLEAAVGLAAHGMYSTTPNPRVGCLIVKDGIVIGRGWHIRRGEGHAEVNALADAVTNDRADAIQGATAYVSLEPCAFESLTPACSRTLIDAGISRVVAAMTDPHPRVAGSGFAELEAAGVLVELVDLPAAHDLVAGYVSRITRGRPFVRIKIAASVDGRTAMANGESQWITGEAARADVQYWRARSCAVVTGAETVLIDDPQLNVRLQSAAVDGAIRQPLRVVLDSGLRIQGDAKIFDSPGEVLVAHVKGRPAYDSAEFLKLPPAESGRVDLEKLFHALGDRGCNEILVEAGPTLAGAVLESGLWDELLLYQASKLLGSDARPLARLPIAHMADAIEATMIDRVNVGDDVRLRFRPSV